VGREVIRGDHGSVTVVGAVLHDPVEELGLTGVRPEVVEVRHPEHRLERELAGSHGALEVGHAFHWCGDIQNMAA